MSEPIQSTLSYNRNRKRAYRIMHIPNDQFESEWTKMARDDREKHEKWFS